MNALSFRRHNKVWNYAAYSSRSALVLIRIVIIQCILFAETHRNESEYSNVICLSRGGEACHCGASECVSIIIKLIIAESWNTI